MIKFACSKCGKHIGVDDKYAGKRGKCPRCGEAVVVPGKSSAIRFSCEHCGHRIKVPQRHAGKKGKCPKCQEAIVVPGVRTKKVKAPVAEVQSPTITCSLCEQPIRVAAGTADEFVECPGCGSLVFAASGAVASAAGEEGAYDESDETSQGPEGDNRRRLFIIAGAAAVVIVCAIGAVLYLTSSKSELPRHPQARRQTPQVADTIAQPESEPQPEPTTPAAAPAEERPAPAITLRFDPVPGTKRIVQLTTETNTSMQNNAVQQEAHNRETLTFELEAAPPDANENIPIAVTLAAVQVRMEAGGATLGEYDSTAPPDSTNRFGKLYSPFVSGRCTMTVSRHGQIVEFDMDKLYRAVAEVRLAASGNASDLGSPSREEQLEALTIQCENSPMLGKQKLCSALEKLVAELPEQPLRVGDTWPGRNVTDIGIPVNMPTKCTLAAASDEVCTIEVEGQRGADEGPVVQDMDKLKMSYTMSGTSQAALTVDRETGWLLSKLQKTNLNGQIETRGVDRSDLDSSSQASVEITITVTTLE